MLEYGWTFRQDSGAAPEPYLQGCRMSQIFQNSVNLVYWFEKGSLSKPYGFPENWGLKIQAVYVWQQTFNPVNRTGNFQRITEIMLAIRPIEFHDTSWAIS